MVHLVDHPLLSTSLSILRNRNTKTEGFRRHAAIVSKVILLEVFRDLRLKDEAIETPLAKVVGKRLIERVILVPVLRAGLAMLFAVQDFLPAAAVGFVGLERDEQTAQAREYYQKLPSIFSTNKVVILDPMLATGGSFSETARIVKRRGAKSVVLASIIAAREGIQRAQTNHPDIRIYTGVIDPTLNDRKFIVPGLGDFGDRYFGTEGGA